MTTAEAAVRTDGTRRTQAERRAATRAKLLDATIASLTELGYGRTTTTEVCQRAGVSQGALFKHFATKAALVSAATEHLFATLIVDYRRAFAALDAEDDKAAAAVDLLWDIFAQPRLHAAFELYIAARTDPELAASLRPVSERHRANLYAEACTLFPEQAADNPRFPIVVGLLMDAMQGAALGSFTLRDPDGDAATVAYLTELVRAELAAHAKG